MLSESEQGKKASSLGKKDCNVEMQNMLVKKENILGSKATYGT